MLRFLITRLFRPASINVAPLSLTSSSLSAIGTTSSGRLGKITVLGLTVLAVPQFSHTGHTQDEFRQAAVNLHRHSPAP